MQIDLEKINKLPPDVRDRFKKLLFKYKEENKKELAQKDFLAFTKQIWPEFIEGSHHKIIAKKFNDLATGKIKRLIVNMPPRHTKSEFASTLLPAWMIGKNPKLKIIQTTHTGELAVRFGRKAKTLICLAESSTRSTISNTFCIFISPLVLSMITSISLSFPNFVRAAFCIALSIEPITNSLSIDFSLATASTILKSSNLSNPLFNIFIAPKKKWAEAHFKVLSILMYFSEN